MKMRPIPGRRIVNVRGRNRIFLYVYEKDLDLM